MPSVRLNLFSIPAEIKPSFWLVALLLGWRGALDGSLAVWVVVLLFSILWHELGHALAWRVLGYPSHIELYAMGGLTYGQPDKPVAPLQRAFVSLAGPGAGFIAGGITLFAWTAIPQLSEGLLGEAVMILLWINLGWGLVNLLPMLPLDGGQVVASVLDFFGVDGRTWTLRLSLLIAACAAAAALYAGWYWAGMLAAWAGATAFGQLRAQRQRDQDAELSPQVQQLWEQVRHAPPERQAALLEAGSALQDQARSPELQAALAQILTQSALRMGDPARAREELERLPGGYRPPPELAGEIGHLLHEQGDFAASAEVSEQLFLDTGEPTHAYNTACSLSRAGHVDDAAHWVVRAVEAGWDDLDALRTDPDLQRLRDSPAWASLQAEL